MAKQTISPLPLPKHWPRRVRSATVHAIALARLAPTTARHPAGTTFAGAGLPPAGTTNLSRHTWATTPEINGDVGHLATAFNQIQYATPEL